MSHAHIYAMSKRLCGHIDMCSFSSKGRSGRVSDVLYANATVCDECRERICRLVNKPGGGFHPVVLPALAGRDGAVRWAKNLRLRALRMLGPIMAQLKQSPDPFAAAVLAVYEMLFKITSSGFWIENRQFSYDRVWVVFEVEHLMRPRPTSTVRLNSSSAFVYWFQADLSVIAAAKEAAHAVIDVDVVPAVAEASEPTAPKEAHFAPSIFL